MPKGEVEPLLADVSWPRFPSGPLATHIHTIATLHQAPQTRSEGELANKFSLICRRSRAACCLLHDPVYVYAQGSDFLALHNPCTQSTGTMQSTRVRPSEGRQSHASAACGRPCTSRESHVPLAAIECPLSVRREVSAQPMYTRLVELHHERNNPQASASPQG